MRSGARLPSTRGLAAELGVSRNAVAEAYDQLWSEGYLERRHGSGTFVATNLCLPESQRPAANGANSALSQRGRTLVDITTSHSPNFPRAFSPGLPSLDPSLLTSWFQASARVRKRVTAELLSYGDSAGYRPLREAIAARLGPARGVHCVAEQVVVTAGTQQALSIAGQLLIDSGDAVWVEDPAYPGAAAALESAGARCIPMPVDADGLNFSGRDTAGRDTAAGPPPAKLAYVTPSHQYPLGVTMSLPRRLELLRWAARSHAWILEDDYDSEFRYDGRSLPALQGLDRAGRVVYFGTFSKTLFPSLRIGYVVAPPTLAPAFAKAVEIAGHGPPLLDQSVLHEFIDSGAHSRHLKRVRAVYAERHHAFCEAVHKKLRHALRLGGAAMGLHVAAELLTDQDDREISRRAGLEGLSLAALSNYYRATPKRGFVMGYGHLTIRQIQTGVAKVAAILGRR